MMPDMVPNGKSGRGFIGLRSETLFQVIIIVGSVSGWGLGIWATLQNELYVDRASIQVLQQRNSTTDLALVELRTQQQNFNTETRQQLGKITEQISDLRALVAGFRDGSQRH